MFCKKCGAEIPNGTKFCSKCGANLSAESSTPAKAVRSFSLKELFTGSKKAYAIATSAILGVLIVAVLLFAIFVIPNMEVNAFKSQIKNREYRDAYRTYEEFDSKDQTKANKWMREYIGTIENDFYKGKLDYSTVTGILEELMQFEAAYNEASKAGENVYLDNQSSIAFEKAKEYAAEEKWQEAYLELQNVHVKYRLYDDVSTLRTECTTQFRADVLEQISGFATDGEIDKLIAARDNALMILPDDKEIIQVSQTHLDAFVTKTLADAATFAENKDFASAKDLLQAAIHMYDHQDLWSALEGYGYDSAEAHCEALVAQNDLLGAVKYAKGLADADSKYDGLLKKYADPLVQNTLATAKGYADNREFEKAISTIAEVQKVYDCSELQAAAESYTTYLPIRLVDCYEVESSDDGSWYGSSIDEGDWTDSLGNEHKDSLRITQNSGYRKYVTYNINEKYATLSGVLAYGAGSSYSAPITIKIYLDDTLIYTSASLVKTSQPTTFSVDITNGKLLRIEVVEGSTSYDDGRCIIDATLS